ncbi:hypothetical protein NIES2104_17560 [Leptolyngbya sp. NIES-2104]|nr:hypothetical protein NIES2104_17560 [Leptolyngbya sp. NIES-2104]
MVLPNHSRWETFSCDRDQSLGISRFNTETWQNIFRVLESDECIHNSD